MYILYHRVASPSHVDMYIIFITNKGFHFIFTASTSRVLFLNHAINKLTVFVVFVIYKSLEAPIYPTTFTVLHTRTRTQP